LAAFQGRFSYSPTHFSHEVGIYGLLNHQLEKLSSFTIFKLRQAAGFSSVFLSERCVFTFNFFASALLQHKIPASFSAADTSEIENRRFMTQWPKRDVVYLLSGNMALNIL